MKRLFTICFALFAALSVGAQEGGDVLRAVSEKLGAMGAYRIDFTLEMTGAESGSEGYCLVDGERYVIAIEDMMQGFDGTTVWVLNSLNKEVTLDAPNIQSRSLFDNPTKAFDFEEELFEVERLSHEAAMIHLYLAPKEGVLEGIESVHLVVDEDTMLPASLGYDMVGVGIYINKVTITPLLPTDGEFEVVAPEGYEVIDFR